MNLPYYIYLITFLGFPILSLILSKYLVYEKVKMYLKWLVLVFAIHNIFFFFGYSFKGDYADYVIFSLEYGLFCVVIFMQYLHNNIYYKICRIIGKTIVIIGIAQGLLGILMFMVISHDYEADKVYHFEYENSSYSTRRYSFGFATLSDTRYNFETYKAFRFLPFEKQINKTVLFQEKSKLNFRDENFRISMKKEHSETLLFFSSDTSIFSVLIK